MVPLRTVVTKHVARNLFLLIFLPVVVRAICEKYSSLECHRYKDPTSSYCKCSILVEENFKNYLCCDFGGQNAQLSAMDTIRFDSSIVANAVSVSYEMHCNSKQNLTFVNVSNGNLTLGSNSLKRQCQVALSAFNSSIGALSGLRSVKLHSSNATVIDHSSVMSVLFMEGSHVDGLLNLNIFREAAYKTESFSLEDSVVQEMRDVTVNSIARIDNSTLNFVNNVMFHQSRIQISTFKNVHSQGLVFTYNTHFLKDVVFEHVAKHGIIFDNSTDVHLEMIEIHSCDAPCILMQSPSVYAERIKINNDLLINLKGTKYIEWAIEDKFTKIKADNTTCQFIDNSKDSHLLCDLSKYHMPIEFEPTVSLPLIVTDNQKILIRSDCFENLLLRRVGGQVLSVPGRAKKETKRACLSSNRKLAVEDSFKLSYIHCDSLHSLSIRRSTVTSLQFGSSVSKVMFENCAVHTVEHLEVTDEMVWLGVHLDYVNILYLRCPSTMTNVHVMARIENFTLDHKPTDQTLLINSTVEFVSTEGITLRRGVLRLKDSVLFLANRAIVVRPEARLLIESTSDKDIPINCLSQPGIVVFKRSQVSFLHPIMMPTWLRDCTTVLMDRQVPSHLEKYSRPIEPADCHLAFEHYALCNMSGSKEPFLLGGTNLLDMKPAVTVLFATQLTLADHCFDEIHLESIAQVNILEEADSCFYKLCLENCTVDKVVNNVYVLLVLGSEIGRILPSVPLVNLNVDSAQIDVINATVWEGEMKNSDVASVSNLEIKSTFDILNSHLKRVFPGSVYVRNNSQLILEDCTIDLLEANAFRIEGKLSMFNVTVDSAVKYSIATGRDAEVRLEHVTFLNTKLVDIFRITEEPNYELINVTLAGKQIEITQKLETNLTKYKVKHVEETKKVLNEDKDQPGSNSLSYILTYIMLVVMSFIVVWLICQVWKTNKSHPSDPMRYRTLLEFEEQRFRAIVLPRANPSQPSQSGSLSSDLSAPSLQDLSVPGNQDLFGPNSEDLFGPNTQDLLAPSSRDLLEHCTQGASQTGVSPALLNDTETNVAGGVPSGTSKTAKSKKTLISNPTTVTEAHASTETVGEDEQASTSKYVDRVKASAKKNVYGDQASTEIKEDSDQASTEINVDGDQVSTEINVDGDQASTEINVDGDQVSTEINVDGDQASTRNEDSK